MSIERYHIFLLVSTPLDKRVCSARGFISVFSQSSFRVSRFDHAAVLYNLSVPFALQRLMRGVGANSTTPSFYLLASLEFLHFSAFPSSFLFGCDGSFLDQ